MQCYRLAHENADTESIVHQIWRKKIKVIGTNMKTIAGDLIRLGMCGTFDLIVHGCNCQCAMGAGLAKSVKSTFPEAYLADKRTLKGAREKLGDISFARVLCDGHPLTVVNGYIQFHWKGVGTLADYDAIRSVMKKIKANFTGMRMAYPKIGSGLARGDWNKIYCIIKEELDGEDHTLVVYST